jgi:putative transcriptional regulator
MTRSSARWSRKAIAEMTAGLIDADLGGSVYKKRVPLPGRGKSGRARIVVATKQANQWFLLYGFGKNEQANIDSRELAAIQKLAGVLLALTPTRLEHAVAKKELVKKSRILAEVNETARGLNRIGVLDQQTLREFDALSIPPVRTLSARQIRAIRARTRMSQAVFAAVLNTSTSTVQKWEIGAKRPSGPSLKLLNVIHTKRVEVLS